MKLKKKIARTKSPPLSSGAAAVRKREVELVQMEFTRLMHAVDDAKRYASVTDLGVTARILNCCYTLIDARKE